MFFLLVKVEFNILFPGIWNDINLQWMSYLDNFSKIFEFNIDLCC